MQQRKAEGYFALKPCRPVTVCRGLPQASKQSIRLKAGEDDGSGGRRRYLRFEADLALIDWLLHSPSQSKDAQDRAPGHKLDRDLLAISIRQSGVLLSCERTQDEHNKSPRDLNTTV